jgi:hypothetical protein
VSAVCNFETMNALCTSMGLLYGLGFTDELTCCRQCRQCWVSTWFAVWKTMTKCWCISEAGVTQRMDESTKNMHAYKRTVDRLRKKLHRLHPFSLFLLSFNLFILIKTFLKAVAINDSFCCIQSKHQVERDGEYE